MQRFKVCLMAAMPVFLILAKTVVAQQATMQFPVERDAGMLGWDNHEGYGDPPVFDKSLLDADAGLGTEEWANHGYMAAIRARKSNQHAVIMDWNTDEINSFLAANADRNQPITWTFNVYPRSAPSADIQIETLESVNDWAEGNGGYFDWRDTGAEGSFTNFNWEEGTLAATTNFAQTAFKIDADGDRVLDLENSLPWIENEVGTGGIDDNQYAILGRVDNFSAGLRSPDLINSELLTSGDIGDASFDFTFASVPLDNAIANALLNDPVNRGIIFGPAEGFPGDNWQIWTREATDIETTANALDFLPLDNGDPVPGPLAPFLEVTFTPKEGGLTGDFDESGQLDLPDVNMLSSQVASGAGEAQFDLNGDANVDSEDLKVWVKQLKKTWFGDADLNGEFGSGDLVDIFTAGKFELDVDATWNEGDWNGDLRFGSGDLVEAFSDGGFELGPVPANAVPEPSGMVIVLVLSLGMTVLRYRTQKSS